MLQSHPFSSKGRPRVDNQKRLHREAFSDSYACHLHAGREHGYVGSLTHRAHGGRGRMATLDQDGLHSLFKRLSLIDSLREGNQARSGDQQPYGGRDHERAEDEDSDLLTGAERRTVRETRATSEVLVWAGGGTGFSYPRNGVGTECYHRR